MSDLRWVLYGETWILQLDGRTVLWDTGEERIGGWTRLSDADRKR
jgi:hypothetical protein